MSDTGTDERAGRRTSPAVIAGTGASSHIPTGHSSMRIGQSPLKPSANTNTNNSNNGGNNTSSTNTLTTPPRRTHSASVSVMMGAHNHHSSSASSDSPSTPQSPIITPGTASPTLSADSSPAAAAPALVNGGAASPGLVSSALPPRPNKLAPKLAPRSASTFKITTSPSSSSMSLNTNVNDHDSDTSSSIGDNNYDEKDLIEQKDDDDDTDEEIEEMHDNFLKELGLGNADKINQLKEQEKRELEMMAGGTKFRVTRCFVGLGPSGASPSSPTPTPASASAPATSPTPSPSSAATTNNNAPNQNANNLKSSQSRQAAYNPRYSIYRPVAPPKKPLPPPPRKPAAGAVKQYTKAQEQSAIRIQRCYRRYKQMLPFKKLKILYRYRWNIVQEIASTERTYLRTLEQLSNLFIEPLRKNGIVSPDDVKFIFGGIDAIIAINRQLLSDIEYIIDKSRWTPYSILGKSFTTMGVFLKAYTDYVKNFDSSLRRLEACNKDMKFVMFIRQAEDRINPRSRLESLLITPVQRIPRYVLLLQDLLKHTESTHPDFLHISEGLKVIKEVAISINDTKRRADNSLKVIEAQNKLVGKFPNLVVADRRYIHEGFLMHGPSNAKAKRVYVFLFNDILLLSKPSTTANIANIFSKSKFKFLKIDDLKPSPNISDIPGNPILSFAFDVELQSDTHTFMADSDETKKLWMSHFKKVFEDINNLQPNNLTLDKRAVEKADQAKTYIDNYFANIRGESKYSTLRLIGSVGRSTFRKSDVVTEEHPDGTATISEKKRTGPPSLNKIFSSIQLKDKDKEKEKEKETTKAKTAPPALGLPPLNGGGAPGGNKSMLNLSSFSNGGAGGGAAGGNKSTLNLSALNNELKNRQSGH
ncbi:hypothetical protein SAMD00019534_010320 [Acytostelium subglobosum LB1]|uniref:hypothetical protein n=1 Tax=Acytostelium subglobosum LB1 TaxID=1410327 RepID=UPI00064517BA|nr:hypothetical protein SAMD00019534_010320 [Acytostelium subglobosum LB1]GAM17857.1 hypothetical protein SAMD00019534_010320 [Acytostelium subglobosum LB1]|eukprot:XP_012758453.1 hypothetical protein SAMD00019534_010320 [Acytostelium subglobosum LB1]